MLLYSQHPGTVRFSQDIFPCRSQHESQGAVSLSKKERLRILYQNVLRHLPTTLPSEMYAFLSQIEKNKLGTTTKKAVYFVLYKQTGLERAAAFKSCDAHFKFLDLCALRQLPFEFCAGQPFTEVHTKKNKKKKTREQTRRICACALRKGRKQAARVASSMFVNRGRTDGREVRTEMGTPAAPFTARYSIVREENSESVYARSTLGSRLV